MANRLLLIKKDDFFKSKLYNSIMDYVFTPDYFGFGPRFPEHMIENYLGGKDIFINNFDSFEPEIESVYLNLDLGLVKTLVISVYNMYNETEYLLVAYNPTLDKYEITYCSNIFTRIDTKENDLNCIDKTFAKTFISFIKDRNITELTGFSENYYISKVSELYYVDSKMLDDKLVDILKVKIAKTLSVININNIVLSTISVDISDIYKPKFHCMSFSYQAKKYDYSFDTDELVEVEASDVGDYTFSFATILYKMAEQQYIENNSSILGEMDNIKKRSEGEQLIKGIYKNFTLFNEDNRYGFAELGKASFITLDDNSINIKTSKNDEEAETVSLSYENTSDNRKAIKRVIDKYITTKGSEIESFYKDAQDFFTGMYDIDTYKVKGQALLDRIASLPAYDKGTDSFKILENKIRAKYDSLFNVDKTKISTALEIMRKIVDSNTYEEYSEDLFDKIDELDEVELSAIKNEYDTFIEKFGDASDYPSSETIYRRVFIRKSALEELKRINEEQKDLKILKITDEVVNKLKTIPGKELGKYLVNKGLNRPITNDRSIKKIRIMKNAKYRLLFVYGSDLDNEDRIENLDSIYIFGVTEHKKEKTELYRLAESKPTKYKINDFIIYPNNNKNIKIPECTVDQYKISTSYEDKPVVTFGCAGSGKTTVSIEQYVNIVYTKFECKSPSSDELVYITFHKGLSDKVKNDLAEFKIDGNCYKLDAYFAYVVGEPYDQNKVINEVKFIDWYNKTYSDEEIAKNKDKKRNRIAPLLNKPDIARLLYTYYRGVFRGSKILFDTKENYLTLEQFMSEMRKETYLSDEEKGAIYEMCKEFYQYTVDNGYLGDNDYALKVIRQAYAGIKKTNCIIIDEVQDLTEVEIIATILTLKDDSQRIYFYGDPHQSINPNLFDGSTINRVYSSLGKVSSSKTAPLTITYRTNKHLISYLNELLHYRDEWIGLADGGEAFINEPPETEDDTSWAGYVTNKDLYNKLFESNPNSMIITPSEATKREMISKYKKIDPARIITIYEAKGMEWDTIIMCNMFTDYETYFKDMISQNGKAKRSTIHRMTFNKYYVGCTRSTKSFVIIEDDDKFFKPGNEIYEALLSSFAPISREEQINSYILENNTFDGWYKEALQNLNNENDSTFRHALAHARRLASTPEEKKLVRDLLEGDSDTLAGYGFGYLEQKEYEIAVSAFIKAYKKNKKYGPYIALSAVLAGRDQREDHIRDLLKHPEIMDKYPDVYKALLKQKAIKDNVRDMYNQLFK